MAEHSHVDIGELSSSQQDALQQYTSVTDQDIAAAISILRPAEWNVQIAVSRFFDGETEPVPSPSFAGAAIRNTQSRVPRSENLQETLSSNPSTSIRPNPDAAPRIVPQPNTQVVRQPPFLLTLLFMPFGLLYKIFSSSLSLFTYLFPFLPRILRTPGGTGVSGRKDTTGRRMLSPQDTAARFKREFEEEYNTQALPFFSNGYAQALDLAKKELKFLLVLLVSPEHDDTTSSIRDTLLSPDFVQFVNNPDNNIILWAGNVQDSEAYQVSTALRCTKFPFTALITHTSESGPATMSVVARLTGPMPPSTYVAKLQGTIATYMVQLTEARNARSAQDFDRTLRQEQDSAYERSLAQDRQRARQRRAEEAERAANEKLGLERAAAKEQYEADLQQWRAWRAQQLSPEPQAEVKDAVRIALRMPTSAERVTRRFRPDASIEELYAFVECYDVNVESAPLTTPLNFNHEYNFRLVSPMPRTVYEVAEEGTLVERIGRSGNLIVEPIMDDEE